MNAVHFRMRIGALVGCLGALSLSVEAATYVWTGASSANWSDGGNWTNGLAPASGGTHDVVLTASGNPPSNQDISGLYINQLFLTNSTTGYAIGGSPLTLKNVFAYDNGTTLLTNLINCSVIIGQNNAWLVQQHNFIFLNGGLGETNGSKYFAANGNGNIILTAATNTFTGGLQNNQAGVTVYGDAALGPVPAAPTANFFQGSAGWFAVGNTDGVYKVVTIHTNRGLSAGNNWEVAANTRVIYNGPISGSGGIVKDVPGKYVGTGGFLVLGGNSTFTGGVEVDAGMIILAHSNAIGTSAVSRINLSSATMDANGNNIVRDIIAGNGWGYDNDGELINSDVVRPVTVSGTFTNGGGAGGNCYAFGGPGDITLAGNITNLNHYAVRKLGGGTLTLKGRSDLDADVSVRCGGLTLDYSASNVSKLSDTNHLQLWHSAVRLVGSDAGSTTETIANIEIGNEAGNVPGAVSFTLAPGLNQNLALSCKSLNLNAACPLEVSVIPNGSGSASLLVTNADQIIGGGATWNRSTWAKIVSGQVTGMSDGEYLTGFAGGVSNSAVDLASGSTLVTGSSLTCQTLRFRGASATTLTITNGAKLVMNGMNPSGTTLRPGILMVANAASVTIDGAGYIDPGLNQPFFVHQNSASPLTISAQFGGSGSGNYLVKEGAGELILTHTNNQLPSASAIYGGTLTITSLADGGSNSVLGSSTTMNIANGTLKYTGTGHAHNRRIGLRGPGAIDASGSGPFRFTSVTNVNSLTGNIGSDFSLVLTGSGEGILGGLLDLHLGGVVKSGSGSWTIGGTQYYTGDTVVSNGILRLTNNCVLQRSVTVTSGGTLGGSATVGGDVVLSGTYHVNVSGDSTYDALAVRGNVTLGGTLDISELNGYRMPGDLNLTVVTAGGTLNGTFSNVTGGTFQIKTSADGRSIVLSKVYPGFIFSVL